MRVRADTRAACAGGGGGGGEAEGQLPGGELVSSSTQVGAWHWDTPGRTGTEKGTGWSLPFLGQD